MADRVYHCAHCNITVMKNSTPTTSGCPRSSFHRWTALGEVGTTDYQCRHCGLHVRTKSSPDTSGCITKSFHSWTRL